jgi:hypothetical protein
MAQTTTSLTEPFINAKARDAAIANKRVSVPGGVRGLWLRITPAGSKSWALMTTDPSGKQIMITLGGYPVIGVATARDLARITREQVRNGATPTADRK